MDLSYDILKTIHRGMEKDKFQLSDYGPYVAVEYDKNDFILTNGYNKSYASVTYTPNEIVIVAKDRIAQNSQMLMGMNTILPNTLKMRYNKNIRTAFVNDETFIDTITFDALTNQATNSITHLLNPDSVKDGRKDVNKLISNWRKNALLRSRMIYGDILSDKGIQQIKDSVPGYGDNTPVEDVYELLNRTPTNADINTVIGLGNKGYAIENYSIKDGINRFFNRRRKELVKHHLLTSNQPLNKAA